jgi:hypothetical protein
MEADNNSDINSAADEGMHYCSVTEAMKLITHPFDGDKKKLKEFIENDVAFELVYPRKHEILLKFVKAKITGDLTHSWGLVKGILEENYATRRTLDYYACRMFNARQGNAESIASWGSRIDALQTDLREAARRVCKPEDIVTRLLSQGRVRRSQVVLTPTRRVSWYPRLVFKGSGFSADYQL